MGSLNKTNAQFYSRLSLTWSDGPIKILGMEVCVDIKNTAKINYQDLINKMDQVMGQWGEQGFDFNWENTGMQFPYFKLILV